MAQEFTVRRQCGDIYQYVSARASKLQGMYLSDSSRNWAARQLAILRRTASKPSGSVPDAWPIEFSGLPESLIGKGDAPSAGENAVCAALALFAMHQQSQQQGMHRSGEEYDIGAAVRRYMYLHKGGENLLDGELPRRFAAMSTADSFEEALHHARQLIQLLKSDSLPIDYGRLARQLLVFQISYLRDGVRLEWGRAYARAKPIANENADETKE